MAAGAVEPVSGWAFDGVAALAVLAVMALASVSAIMRLKRVCWNISASVMCLIENLSILQQKALFPVFGTVYN